MPPRPDRDLLPSELARLEEVRRVGTERSDELARTFVEAFADDPFLRWMSQGAAPDFDSTLWRFALGNPGAGVEIMADQTSSAAAIWEPPEMDSPTTDRASDSVAGFRQLLVSQVGEDRTAELMDFYRQMGALRPTQPHWYLSAIAVRPAAQNRGWGSRLLQPMLMRCDQAGVPIYLESSNPQNHSFYARHGFVSTGTHAPPGGPELTLMLRTPA